MSCKLSSQFACLVYFTFLLITPLSAQHEPHSKLDSYVEQASELSARARANVYFANPQSVFKGVQVGFVNVGTGNLTFLRRDMVASGRVPLVFARVYDSSSKGSLDFGVGWRLSAAESISLQNDRARLLSENGTVIPFLTNNGRTFQLEKNYPSDYVGLVLTEAETIRATLRTGVIKEFRKTGDTFLLVRVIDRNGNELKLAYERGRLAGLENATHSIAISRNERGRISLVQDDSGRKIQYIYDNKGRLSEVDDLGGLAWTYAYFDDGKLKSAKDPLQRLNFAISFDDTDRVRRIQTPAGVMRFDYDVAMHLTAVVDRKEMVSKFFQNDEGITTRVVNALGEETSITLNSNHDVTSLSRNGGIIEKMEFDQKHRLVQRTSSAGPAMVDVIYSYDPDTGFLSTISSSGQEQTFDYETHGNLSRASLKDGERTYTYSAEGSLATLSVGGKTVTLSQNPDGLINSVTQGHDVTSMQYKAGGELSSITFPGGLKAKYQYLPSGLRSKLTFSNGRSTEYSYDPAGNLAGSKVFDKNGKQVNGQKLVMNDSYELLQWTLFDGTETNYQYDANGNLTTIKKGRKTTRFEYDSLNRLTAVVTPGGERLTYQYEPGERSIIEQHQHSSILVEDLRDSGLNFGDPMQIMATRPVTGTFGPVRFSESLGAFQLSDSSGSEIVLPSANVEAALKKMFLFDRDISSNALRSGFNIPFNTMFMPAEYVTINCCPECFYGDDGWDCPPCGGFTPPRPHIDGIDPSSANVTDQIVPVQLSGSFNDNAFVEISGAGVTSSGELEDPFDIRINSNFIIDPAAASIGAYTVTVFDDGGESDNSVTFTVNKPSCPLFLSVANLTPIPLERDFPTIKTGIGAIATMAVNPPSSASWNWNGTLIGETVVPLSNGCGNTLITPDEFATLCSGSTVFRVGNAVTEFGITVGPITNALEDEHLAGAAPDQLASVPAPFGCHVTCAQTYSCGLNNLGIFTIDLNFFKDTIGGVSVTRVSVQK